MTRIMKLLFWLWRCFLSNQRVRNGCCNTSLLQSCCKAAVTGSVGSSLTSSRLKRKNDASASFSGVKRKMAAIANGDLRQRDTDYQNFVDSPLYGRLNFSYDENDENEGIK